MGRVATGSRNNLLVHRRVIEAETALDVLVAPARCSEQGLFVSWVAGKIRMLDFLSVKKVKFLIQIRREVQRVR